MLQRNAVVYGGCGLEDVGITVHGGGSKMLRFVQMYSDLLRVGSVEGGAVWIRIFESYGCKS